jgi:transposase InsO family protein
MREAGLRVKGRKPRRPQTTDSRHGYEVAANVLGRRFSVEQAGGVNRVWCGDITYVPTREGWLYLAVLLDLGSRAVVGWAMGETLESSLATEALRMALGRRSPEGGLLHHTDRGSQYAAIEYREMLDQRAAVASVSGRGNCYDNAVAESFFATLEWELIQVSDWQTRAEARRAIFEYIECWYNRQRRHSSLGYLSPLEYEQRLSSKAA